MIETQLLKGNAAPCVELRLVQTMLPIVDVGDMATLDEMKMKLAITVNESITYLFSAFSKRVVTGE